MCPGLSRQPSCPRTPAQPHAAKGGRGPVGFSESLLWRIRCPAPDTRCTVSSAPTLDGQQLCGAVRASTAFGRDEGVSTFPGSGPLSHQGVHSLWGSSTAQRLEGASVSWEAWRASSQGRAGGSFPSEEHNREGTGRRIVTECIQGGEAFDKDQLFKGCELKLQLSFCSRQCGSSLGKVGYWVSPDRFSRC